MVPPTSGDPELEMDLVVTARQPTVAPPATRLQVPDATCQILHPETDLWETNRCQDLDVVAAMLEEVMPLQGPRVPQTLQESMCRGSGEKLGLEMATQPREEGRLSEFSAFDGSAWGLL